MASSQSSTGASRGPESEPVQWNTVSSEAGDLRGVHVHVRHDDYLTMPVGRTSVGLRDLRRGSPTEGLAVLVELGREQPAALVIPHGVAHGFYFHEPSLHVYAVSEYWEPDRRVGLSLGRSRARDRVAYRCGARVGARSRRPAAAGAASRARALAADLTPRARSAGRATAR